MEEELGLAGDTYLPTTSPTQPLPTSRLEAEMELTPWPPPEQTNQEEAVEVAVPEES